MSVSEAEVEKQVVAQWIEEKNTQIDQANTIKIDNLIGFCS
ncbi:hypothetical protein [Priestia aryabhattai]